MPRLPARPRFSAGLSLRPRHALPLLSLGLGLVGAFGFAAQEQVAAGDEAPGPQEPPPVERIDAAELWAHPGLYLGQRLRIRFRHKEWQESWQPFLTRFGPAEYRALVGWGEREFPWEETAWEAPQVRAFVRRESGSEWALEDIARLQSVELEVVVRQAFASQPWVEVVGVVPCLYSIPEGSVLHASRALGLMDDGYWDRAESELERALAPPLPEVAREELKRLIDACEEGRAADAAERERAGRNADG